VRALARFAPLALVVSSVLFVAACVQLPAEVRATPQYAAMAASPSQPTVAASLPDSLATRPVNDGAPPPAVFALPFIGLAGLTATEKIARVINDLSGSRFVAGARASLNFGSIAAGLQERLTVTVTGALLGDFAQAAPEADIEAGLEFTAYVSAADTVTVTMSNNTAGAIDPAAVAFRVRVTREAKR
jgi:hypothetical protein